MPLLLLLLLLYPPMALACLGPPYLYATFHGGEGKGDINEVYIYTRDGCYLGEAIRGDTELNELRGMVLYGDSLILANANRQSSFIVQFKGACRSMEDLKEMRVMVPPDTALLDHPYGVAVGERYLYVSSQGSDTITRYYLTTGAPADISPALIASGKVSPGDKDIPGLFAVFDPKSDGVRGIVFEEKRRLLFVANKDEGVVVFDEDGYRKAVFDADKPISVTYCKARDSILVGSKGDDTVTEWDPDSFERVGKWKHKLLSHPAGLACHNDDVAYVVSQDKGLILAFDLTKESKPWVVVDDMDDKAEHLLLGYTNHC